jgi:hypothetical protein
MAKQHVHFRVTWEENDNQHPGKPREVGPFEAFKDRIGHEAKEERANTTITITSPVPLSNVPAGNVSVSGTVTGVVGTITVSVVNLVTGFGQTLAPFPPGTPWSVTFQLGAGQYRVDAASLTTNCTDLHTLFFTVS